MPSFSSAAEFLWFAHKVEHPHPGSQKDMVHRLGSVSQSGSEHVKEGGKVDADADVEWVHITE
jgi:hypothetical protein